MLLLPLPDDQIKGNARPAPGKDFAYISTSRCVSMSHTTTHC